MTNLEIIRAGIETLSPGDQRFAHSLMGQAASGKSLSDKQAYWVGILADRVQAGGAAAPNPSAPAIQVGEFAGVIALFERAKKRLKAPKIRLQTESGAPIALALAGARSRAPGTISVTDGGRFGESLWYGRVTPAGAWEPGKDAKGAIRTELTAILAALAAAPAATAAAYGRLTGQCCFCRLALSDPRSTAVGYGETCAGNYGLPWGAKAPAYGL